MMSLLANIDRVNVLLNKLEGLKIKAKDDGRSEVEVGYDTHYAIYVHEDLTMNHPNGGQAKYLEQPARQNIDEIRNTVIQAMLNREGLPQAMLKGAQHLLALSQPLVPVDTGDLKRSGYARFRNASRSNKYWFSWR